MTKALKLAMLELKMSPDYSHFNSDNFELFLSPQVGRLKEIFKLIRRRSASCEICVTLNDQPTNDFTTLDKNVEDFKNEIRDDFLAVHTIPGCAYQRCLPDETIDIRTCSLVLHWLSDRTMKPVFARFLTTVNRVKNARKLFESDDLKMLIGRYVVLENALFYVPGLMVRNEERTQIRSLAANDLKNFIQSRSNEMKKGAIFFVNIPAGPLDINEICSSTYYQLYQRNVISKEELRNTFVPIYNGRTETEVKAPFVEFGENYGVDLMHFSQRIIPMYENKDPVPGLKSWILQSLMAGLCQTRSNNDAADVCELFFQDLRSRLYDMKWANYRVYEVIFQKL